MKSIPENTQSESAVNEQRSVPKGLSDTFRNTINQSRKNLEMIGTRRKYLATAGSALLGAGLLPALADDDHKHEKDDADVLYGHGMVWNRDLPGAAGDLKLSFDLRVNLLTGAGFGTADDPIHPDWNIHYAINSVKQEKVRKGETLYEMTGVVTRANNPANVGLPVRILAQTSGDTTAVAIALGNLAFGGAGLVVIAIIAVLIALLVPAVQKVR